MKIKDIKLNKAKFRFLGILAELQRPKYSDLEILAAAAEIVEREKAKRAN